MNDRARRPRMRLKWTAEHDAAVQLLAAAAQRVQQSDTPDSRAALADAVDAARQGGVGWTKIGDTLGIASGNAYQRYRKRSGSSSTSPG